MLFRRNLLEFILGNDPIKSKKLQYLFSSASIHIPDFQFIFEIMPMAERFKDSLAEWQNKLMCVD
jgi:hypothetical protein